jgi:hypothetical protein
LVANRNSDAMLEADIAIDLPFKLIQVLRLAHALVEVGCRLHVTADDAEKLAQLQKVFKLPYEVDGAALAPLPGLIIDHMKPETRVGSISRPLIFPRAAFAYCRERWPKSRPVRASFPGKPTASRREVINEWLSLSGLELRLQEESAYKRPLVQRAVRALQRKLGIPRRDYIHSEGVKVILSEEGRLFPRKAWNKRYYDALLEAEFVLCPDGDFGKSGVAWTYRFFESTMCGAIPIIENHSPIYEGFRFRTLSEPLSSLVWSYEDAAFNFDLACERLIVPADELRAEVMRLASSPATPGTGHASTALGS